ncbi:efflux RND transporter periplasmic adaptor subunit [Paenibacillus sp. y28]|uniref:efflux RND transporter periplasmic adaptor subunit n=1 Tax=Paenibacillus sp. y28 TaxID=3129110 RepID=UPI0030178749
MKYRGTTRVALILLAAAALTVSGCSGKAASAGSAGPAVVKTVQIGAATAGVSGKIAPDQTVQIVSKTSGKVKSVEVGEGAKVKQGDVLVQLETDDLELQVNQAQAGLAAAQAKLADTEAGARLQDIQAARSGVDQAAGTVRQTAAAVEQAQAANELQQRTFNKLRNRFDNGEVTQDELDQGQLAAEKTRTAYEQALAQKLAAEATLSSTQAKYDLLRAGATSSTLDALRAEVTRTQAALEIARNAMNQAAVRAPIDGTVVKKIIHPGEMAQAGSALLTVVDMHQVSVEVSVPENMIQQVKVGQQADVRVASLQGKAFEGTVSFASPVSDSASNTFPVKLTVPNADGLLLAGTLAEVSFTPGTAHGLEIPKVALLKKGDKTVVYKLDGDVVHEVSVVTEEKNQDWVYVQGNGSLKSEDRLVLNPVESLTDGAKVKAE